MKRESSSIIKEIREELSKYLSSNEVMKLCDVLSMDNGEAYKIYNTGNQISAKY